MKLFVHVIAHTHWDREWYLTREQFRLRLVDLVDRVLDLLEGEPRFTAFHLDGQTVVLEDYLEVRPEQEGRLRAQVAAGRLLVGPWYVMPDEFLVSGEALVRNLGRGHRIAEGFGRVMPVGYVPDPFGHVGQLPQILRGFGLDNAIHWRGFGGRRAEYVWEAPDRSRVFFAHLPEDGYCNALRLPLQPERGARIVAAEAERAASGHVLLMAGVDHVEPHPRLLDAIEALNAVPGVEARLSTLPAYVDAARAALSEGDLEVVRGELRAGQEHAFLLPGVLSARTYLKQANARVQRALEHAAEPLALFAWRMGAPWPAGPLAYAWQTLLRNHPHDSICGCSIDSVHEENLTRFAQAGQVAEELSHRALRTLAGALPEAPDGVVRVLAVNTDTRPFQGVLDAVVDVPIESFGKRENVDAALLEAPLPRVEPGAALVAVRGPDGAPVAFVVPGSEEAVAFAMSRFQPPWALRVRRLHVVFDAAVPALGHAAYDVVFEDAAANQPAPADPVTTGERFVDNASVRVEANADGTFDVLDKRSGEWLRRCAELEDTGDVGDEYTYCPPGRDHRVTSADARNVRIAVRSASPLRGTLEVALELPLPAAVREDRRARADEEVVLPVTLAATVESGAARVTFAAALENRARDHRLRVLFPTGAARVASARADTAFDAIERPAAASPAPPGAREDPVATQPMLSFVDAGDEARGVTVVADGLAEYEVVGGSVALTLLRCVGYLSRGDLATRRGHAGPGLPTPGAQCLGTHAFRFAMAPRAAPPRAAELYAEARRFLSPPRVIAGGGGGGRLDPSGAWLVVKGDPIVLSALKRADDRDAVVLRVFNPEDRPATFQIGEGAAGWRLDLRERRVSELPLRGSAVELTVGPRRVETVELSAPPTPAPAAPPSATGRGATGGAPRASRG